LTETPVSKYESQMTCEEFQQLLPELFESGIDLDKHPHLQACDNCAALVRDLNYIAQQAKLLLPIQDPSPTVWKKIRTALELGPEQKEHSGTKGR
jgi:hypothetical protein